MAVISMTGYGHAQCEENGIVIEVEAKSVNHRFLDVSQRLPQALSKYELDLQRYLSQRVKRGHFDIYVTRRDRRAIKENVVFNQSLFLALFSVSKEALKLAGMSEEASIKEAALNALGRREIIEMDSAENVSEGEDKLLLLTLEKALDGLVAMRVKEGEALSVELSNLLGELAAVIERIKDKAPDLGELFCQRLKARIQKLNLEVEVDQSRLMQEIAILADRSDITEELARLGSHLTQFKSFIELNSGGRKLDFLIQEMTREINTIGSKAQNSDISAFVIEAKALTEKLREQVQNIE